ncbi:MAG: hypothetical protein ACSLFR_05035 [Solirubrobacteraceae bacterium]
MSTVLGAPARLVLAFAASTFLLLGLASSANAATYAQIQSAQPGDTLTLSPSVTLTPGTITQAGDTLEISGATVTYGEAGSGEGVTAVVTADSLTLTGGSFTFKDKIATGTFTPDADDPMTFALGDTAAAESTGSLVPAPTAAPAALRTFAISGEAAEDAALGLLPTIPADNGPNFYTIDINANGGTINVNLRQKQRQSSGAVVETGRVLVAVNPINLRYRVEVIDWKFTFGPSNTTLNAVVAGQSILNPFEFTGVSGTLTGEAQLVKGLWLTGGTLTWDKTGFHVAGSVRVDCQEGSVSAGLTGDIVDGDDWKFAVSGQTNAGCTVTKDLTLPTGDLTGEIKSEAGAQTGLLEVGGVVQTTLLPEGVKNWDARLRFIYDGTDAGSYVAFYAAAGIGTAQGKINFDGTFALNADFTIPFGNSSVAFDGDLKRETPGGAVTYDVGGSANIAINSKASLGGSLRLTNTKLTLAGDVTLACPVDGTIKGGVAGEIPLTSSKDWSIGISGGAGSAGCQVTKEFGLAAGSGLAGSVTSVGGVVSLNADANATIDTTLVPTKTSFTAGFTFAASQGAYSVAVNGSTQGAGFAANVKSDGTFGLSFNLDDLALGGVTLGAKGTIDRTTPGGAVAYSISGSLAGQAKIYENLYLRGGSLSIDSTGGLKFSGTVRQICNTGYLDASATGIIVDSRNWAFDAKGIASACTIGRAAKFNGTTFYAQIKSENAKVLYNAGVRATQINLFSTYVFLLGTTTTYLTNVGATISNTCDGCQEQNKFRVSFGGTGNAQFRVILLPAKISISLSGQVDIRGTSVRKVSLALNRNLFASQFAQNQIEIDTEKAFTTAT